MAQKFISLFSLTILLTSCASSIANSAVSPGGGTKINTLNEFQLTGSEKFSYKLIESNKIPETEKGIFENRLKTKLAEKDIFGADSNLVLEITFDEYYIRDAAARLTVGILAGVDNITTSIVIKDKLNEREFGRFEAISRNATIIGSKNAFIEQHADKIASFLQ